jgi:hypothetical protein
MIALYAGIAGYRPEAGRDRDKPALVARLCLEDAARRGASTGSVICPECDGELRYRLRSNLPGGRQGIDARCARPGCMIVIG